jgi:hypothetical protein
MRVMWMTGMVMRKATGSREPRLTDRVIHHDVIADVALDRVGWLVVWMVLLVFADAGEWIPDADGGNCSLQSRI